MSKVKGQTDDADFSGMQHLTEELVRYRKEVDHLSRQDHMLKNIVAHAADGVFLIDQFGVVVECFVDYGTLTDLRKDQIIGHPIWDVFKRIRLEDSLYKHPMEKADLPTLFQAAANEEQSIQVIARRGDDVTHTQALHFLWERDEETLICISIKDITAEYVQKYHLERNRVRLRMMVKQRTEEYDTLNQELVKVNEELSEQIKEKIKAQDELAEMVRTQTLADSEIRFRHIINKLQDMVTIVDEQGLIIYVTPSCRTTYGYEEEELIGQSTYSIIHPDDISKVKVYMNSVLQREELTDCNYRIRRKSGDWAEVKAVTVNMLNDPHINGYVTTYTDVTEQNKAQQRITYNLTKQQLLNRILIPLQKSEDIAATIDDAIAEVGRFADVGQVFIIEKSDDGKSTSMTYEWCNTGVMPRKNKFQQISVDLLNPWKMDLSDGIILRYPGSKNVNPQLIDVLLTDDSQSFILLPLFINGDLCGYFGFSEHRYDRSWTNEEESLLINFAQILSSALQRQKSEKAQRMLQQALSTVLDNISIHIYVIDKESHEVLFANKAVRDAKGNELVNIKQDTIKSGINAFEHYDQQTDSWTYQISIPITWIDGRLVYLRTVEDITERKKMELELLTSRDRAEESDKLKSAFLTNMSHEIRTPMNAIIGFSQILRKEVVSNELQKFCDVINENCNVLLKLIDDIIDISKIEADQMKITLVSCDLNRFLEEIKSFYQQQLQRLNKSSVELQVNELPDETIVKTDSIRLRQILGNLLDNAIKFTDSGSIKVTCDIPGDGLIHFSVEDSGIGIPENQQEVIFERFRQLEQLRNLSGTGLGLAISKSLAQMLGGTMGVHSVLGEGSTFYFTIKYELVDID